MHDQPGEFISTLPSRKLKIFAKTALEDGFELVQADTCCIDRADRSELVEAINSMFNWYAYAGVCYALLGDHTT